MTTARDTVDQLRLAVAQGLGYEDCRVFGDAERSIRRFAFLIGGFGENQYHMPRAARDLGAEALIIGEMSEFIVISAGEIDRPSRALHSQRRPGLWTQAGVIDIPTVMAIRIDVAHTSASE